MINKIKNIARKGISLVLALAMMMPTGAYAGTHSVTNWDGYREKLKSDIMMQQKDIIINFSGSEIFTSEYSARLKIEAAYKQVTEELPKHFGELNIIGKTTLPILDGTSFKSATHIIEYKISAQGFAELNTILNKEYSTIKTKSTDYEKIRAAYDYVVGSLSNIDGIKVPRIKEILAPQGDNSYTVLFALMMTELGYDNDIATRQDGSKWNIVKVQGLWYHVEGKLEANQGQYNQFLISKNLYFDNWDSDIPDEYFSDNKYNGNPPTVPQLKYEIELIKAEITNITKELEKIFDGVSIEQISEVKDKINAIKGKVENYKEIINILRSEINKIEDEPRKSGLLGELVILETSINDVTTKIYVKETVILALEKAIEAVVKAENTKSDVDIAAAKDEVANIDIENLKISLEMRLASINAEIAAKLAVDKAEKALKDNKIEDIEIAIVKDAIGKVTTDSIRAQLFDRIGAVEIAIAAIESVNAVEGIIATIISLPNEIENIIANAEAAVKMAELSVKNIKDLVVKANQQNRIKEIKLVITAIKAVKKAEITLPLRITYVTSAKTAVDKITGYDSVKIILEGRLHVVEAAITSADEITKAVKAVEKAEKYMKIIDISLAREAVELLTDGEIKQELNRRINATDAMVKAESSLAKYLIDYSEVNEEHLQTDIDNADSYIALLKEGAVKIQRISRLKVIKSAKFATELVEAVRNSGAIESAKEAISKVTDIKIQSELVKKLEAIISQKLSVENLENAKQAVADAKSSLSNINTKSITNIEAVAKAVAEVNKLPTGIDKTSLQNIIKELNNAIKAKQAVENADVKLTNNSLTEKDIIAAEKLLITVNKDYKPGLDDRIKGIRLQFETNKAAEFLEKANYAVGKAEETRIPTDITLAKKAVELVNNVDEKANLNTRIKAMESYIATIKVLVNAEKYRNIINKNAADSALNDFKKVVDNVAVANKPIYNVMINNIQERIAGIGTYLTAESDKVTKATEAVELAEALMKINEEPDNKIIQTAQLLVNVVTDNVQRAGLQKSIDAIQSAKDAKAAVAGAEAYINEKSVKDAETALSKVDRTKYLDIVKNLSGRIAALRNKLDITKKVTEATSLVQKAVDSRISADSIKARFVVDGLKDLALDSFNRLTTILNDLDKSIGNEVSDEANTLSVAKSAIGNAIDIINGVKIDITKIIEGEDGEIAKIKTAYEKIETAKIEIIKANAAVRKLTNQKDLLGEIDFANKEIELAEDNIDVKEAVRTIKIASSSVNDATTEEKKSLAKLDISAARRAIDKIGHSNNKAVKTTILNTINSIEKKLTSDNDQELINAAVEEVNKAADLVTKAVRDNNVMIEQEKIDKAIFSAKLAIGWISDNNKSAKDTLTGFINDIEAMFTAEKEGIKNAERITNAEKAVAEAEAKKGSVDLEGYIRSARLRVGIIINDGPETEAKIVDLNGRLDVLEGKTGGNSGNNGSDGNTKPGGSNGSNKPGGSTTINIVPTTPLPDSKRVIGTTEPIWGKTKELKKTNPTIGLSVQEMTAFKVNESKLKTIELSNILSDTSSTSTTLIVRGKTIKLESKPYINDKLNNSILLPVKLLGDELGFAVTMIDNPLIKGAKRILINGLVNGQTKSIIMDIGSEYAYVNGNLVKISSKPVIQDGRTYIPVDFMVEHLGVSFSYYNQGGNIQLIIN